MSDQVTMSPEVLGQAARAKRTLRVGFVGWRGMVGSVLMQRMLEEKDFALIEPAFFTTSNVGGEGPAIGKRVAALEDARDIAALEAHDAIVTCQGGDYTAEVYPKLRATGWDGYWIDAARTLRMQEDAVIILDPVNRPVIDAALARGVKNYIGGNCTVSLMMMALAGLFRHDLIEWMTCMTYQAASGAGAQTMRELLQQMGEAHSAAKSLLDDPASAILDIDRDVAEMMRDERFPTEHTGVPLAGSLPSNRSRHWRWHRPGLSTTEAYPGRPRSRSAVSSTGCGRGPPRRSRRETPRRETPRRGSRGRHTSS